MENKITDSLNKAGSSLTEGLKEQLAIGEKSGQTYSQEDHIFLRDTLRMSSCTATIKLEEKRKIVDLTSIKMTVVKEFTEIQKTFGNRVILDYAGLLQLCNEHNLYFGHTSLFCGDMTPEAVEEAKKFNFDKARTNLRVGARVHGKPVVGWHYHGATECHLIIAAPITMFKLASPNKIVIVNREIVEHSKGSSARVTPKPCTQDPVLLLPFRSDDDQIYFLLITNW